MKYIKQLAIIAVLAAINQSAQAVKFYVKNNTPDEITLNFDDDYGKNYEHKIAAHSEPPSYFNNGSSQIDDFWWEIKDKSKRYAAYVYKVDNANIKPKNPSDIEHLVILPKGEWTWEGVSKPKAKESYYDMDNP